MRSVFISYRRNDSSAVAHLVFESLEQASFSVFFDLRSIESGVDFETCLQMALDECDLLIALIGPSWMSRLEESVRHVDAKDKDWVRVEIGSALARQIPILPVLIDGTPPVGSGLPVDLAGLARLHAFPLETRSTLFEVQRGMLVQAARRLVSETVPQSATQHLDWGLLPYRVDRDPETEILAGNVLEVLRTGTRRPMVCILGAPYDECPDSFADVFKEKVLPRIIHAADMPSMGPLRPTSWDPVRPEVVMPDWLHQRWPAGGGDQAVDRFVETILVEPEGSESRIAGGDRPASISLYRTSVDCRHWSRDDEAVLGRLLDKLQGSGDLAPGHIVFLLIIISRAAESAARPLWSRWLTRRPASPDAILDRLARYSNGCVTCIPRLGPVSQYDANQWADRADSQGLWRHYVQPVKDEIQEYFSSNDNVVDGEVSMRHVSEQLRAILKMHAHHDPRLV